MTLIEINSLTEGALEMAMQQKTADIPDSEMAAFDQWRSEQDLD